MDRYTAFADQDHIATGALEEVVRALQDELAVRPERNILLFDNTSGRTLDLDLRGELEDVLLRLPRPASPEKPGPGRPKLGVVAREVTLLPRHWEWLNNQPGGASVALRKLVEMASRASRAKDQARVSLEACHRFITAMAGDLAGYEEAIRALFAQDFDGVRRHFSDWPNDIAEHAEEMLLVAQNDAYEARED